MTPSTQLSTATPPSTEKQSRIQTVMKMVPTLIVMGVMGAGWLFVHEISLHPEEHPERVMAEEVSTETIELPQGKLDAAQLQCEPVQIRSLQHSHTVPGRLLYDETKHIEVRAPLDGIVEKILVTPGDQVQKGDLLAILRSPEIGRARGEVLKRRKDREIAQQVQVRETTLTNHLEQLSAMLDQGKPIEAIEAAFANRALGNYRHEILSAYAKMKLAADLLNKIKPLANTGSVSGRTVRERETEVQLAETAFRTARDQATFAATQVKLKADADLAEADRQLNLATQSVEALLGCKEAILSEVAIDSANVEEALSKLEVKAPLAGSIESQGFASNERVTRGDSLLVLANTDSLYVSASLRENDWSAIGLQPGTSIRVLVPALGDRPFEATLRYVGREVQSSTNSVPLVATILNQEGLLRPGMYIRVTVPIGEPREALSVRNESIVQHDNQQFVFVDLSNGAFKRVDVTTGQTSPEWIEVTSGLTAGERVVTNGAFLLKSELLLRGEGE